MRYLPDGTIVYFPLTVGESEVACGWYCELPGLGRSQSNVGNILAMVFRDSATDPWKLVLRTRIYLDSDLTESTKDRKQGYMVTAEPDQDPEQAKADLIAKADQLLEAIQKAGGELTKIDQHKDTEDFMRIWGEQPWAHMSHHSGPEAEKRFGRRYT